MTAGKLCCVCVGYLHTCSGLLDPPDREADAYPNPAMLGRVRIQLRRLSHAIDLAPSTIKAQV